MLPAAAMWLSLIRAMSKRPKRWFWPPPRRTAHLSRTRSPRRLTCIQDHRPRAGHRRHVLPGQGCDARHALHEVERHALAHEDGAARPLNRGNHLPAPNGVAITTSSSTTTPIQQCKHPLHHRQPGDHTIRFGQELSAQHRVGGNRARRGHIPAADVLGQGVVNDVFDIYRACMVVNRKIKRHVLCLPRRLRPFPTFQGLSE